ncbi:MAG: alpha/beta hydrolase [Kocuria sp.]|nr:alpha/beta hydrolase [Kocuria sp.]
MTNWNEFERSAIILSVTALLAMKCREQYMARLASRYPNVSDSRNVTEDVFTSRLHNDISYRHMGDPQSEDVFVLLHGLGVSSTTLMYFAERILRAHPDSWVIVPDRAGYRRSRVGAMEPFNLREPVADLADLLRARVGERRAVTLIGHSLGGLIAQRLAEEEPGLVHRLILLEPTHPHEARQSPVKRRGVLFTTMDIEQTAPLMSWGAAALLNEYEGYRGWRRQWRKTPPSQPWIPLIAAEREIGRTWRAFAREWRYLSPWFLDGTASLPRLPEGLEAHLFISSDTRDGLKETDQLSLLDSIAPGCTIHDVPDSNHHLMVMNCTPVEHIVRLITSSKVGA